MKYILVLSLLVFLSSCQDFIKATPDCSSFQGGNLFGEIMRNADECAYNLDTLVLKSTGGLVVPAIKISNQVKLNDTNTIIYGYCNSSCGMIAASGNVRKMCKGSTLGFHKGNIQSATDKVLSFYKDIDGVNYEAVKDLVLSRENNDMREIGAYEAKQLGLIDEIILCRM